MNVKRTKERNKHTTVGTNKGQTLGRWRKHSNFCLEQIQTRTGEWRTGKCKEKTNKIMYQEERKCQK